MKKLLVLLFMSILVLFGCSDTSATTTSTEQIEDDEIVWFMQPDNSGANNSEAAFPVYLEEQTGASIQYMSQPSSDEQTKVMLDLSSQTQYNLVVTGKADLMAEVVTNDLYVDLRPYLEEYGQNILAAIPQETWDMVTDPETGAIYAIPGRSAVQQGNGAIIYRKDILAEGNLPVPTTTDELLEVSCAAAEQELVSTPYAVNWGSISGDNIIQESFGAYGVTWDWNVDENGELVYRLTDPAYYEFLDWANAMYECGGFGVDYETIDQDQRNARFIQGDALFMQSWSGEQQQIADALATQGIAYEDAIGILPPLKGPDGDYPVYRGGPGSNTIHEYAFIPAYMEQYAAQTISIINQMYTPEFITGMLFAEDQKGIVWDQNEDGTYHWIPGGDKSLTPIPMAEIDYFFVGIPQTALQASTDAYYDLMYASVESGENTSPNDAFTYQTQMWIEEYDMEPVINPINGIPIGTAPDWDENSGELLQLFYDATDMYTSGQKTADDIPALEEQLTTKYNMPQFIEDINAWYDTSYNKTVADENLDY